MGRTNIGTPVKFQVHGPAGKLLFDLRVATITNGGNTITSMSATVVAPMTIPTGSWITLLDSAGNYVSDSRLQQGQSLKAQDKISFTYQMGATVV